MIMFARSRQEKGFSLPELMVAITIALIILAAVAMMFVNSRKAYNTQDRLARVQENGRFAMFYLMRNIRLANFTGCLKNPTGGATAVAPLTPATIGSFTNNLNVPATDFSYGISNMAVTLEGIDDVSAAGTKWFPSGSVALPASVSTNAIRKSDLLSIRGVSTQTMFPIAADLATTADPITLSPANAVLFKQNDVVMVGDCFHTDLFQVTNTPTAAGPTLAHAAGGGTIGNNSGSLYVAYKAGSSSVFTFSTLRYFVRDNTNGVPSLYMDDGTTAVELVEGIESLQFLYGVDTDGDLKPNRYLKAGQVGLQTTPEWATVVSVRIGVLARTTNAKDTDTDNNIYDVNGTSIGPFGDRNQRRVFTATVLLKNRVLP